MRCSTDCFHTVSAMDCKDNLYDIAGCAGDISLFSVGGVFDGDIESRMSGSFDYLLRK